MRDEDGRSISEIAALFGVSYHTIRRLPGADDAVS